MSEANQGTPLTRRMLLIAAILVAALPTSSAQAATPGYLQIREPDPAIAGFQVSDVLYAIDGFDVQGILSRGVRYAAYGAVSGQLAVATSETGNDWTSPVPATIAGPGGSVPFTVGTGNRLAATYVSDDDVLPHTNRFVIVYAPAGAVNERGTAAVAVDGTVRVQNLRYAFSTDGVRWTEDYDARVSNNQFNATSGVITGAGSSTFKEGIAGPTDLVYNDGKRCFNNAVPNEIGWAPTGSPFDCEFTLTYTSIDQAGNTSVAIAGGVYFLNGYLELRGTTVPALSRTATTWSGGGIDRAHVRQINAASWTLGFSGSSTSQRCNGVADACQAGTASSTNGRTFTPDRPSTPSLKTALTNGIAGKPTSIVDLQPMADGTSEPHFFVGFGGSTWNAYGIDPGSTAPRLIFIKPKSGYVSVNDPNITFVLNDDFGTNVGIDLGKLDVRVDGAPFSQPMAITNTGIGSVIEPGKLFTIPGSALTDGMHTLSVSAKDLDGEMVTGARSILVDRTKPASTIAEVWSTGYTFPLNGIFVKGSAQDPGTPSGLQRMRGTVTNPLGQTMWWEEGFKQTNNVNAGFNFTNAGAITPNGGPRSWDYTWAPPMDDELFWAIPGPYEILVTSFDFAGNPEGASAANRRSLMLI